MLREDLKKIKGSKAELKKFGRGGSIFFLVLAAVIALGKREFPWPVLFLTLSLGSFGYLLPKALKPVYLVWMPLAITLGWLITRLILIMLFFLIITPISLIGRLFKAKFLDLKIEPQAKTYWLKRKNETFDQENYERQS